MLTLLCPLTMAAQPTVTKCEYWFDRQFDSRTEISMADGTWSEELNVSALSTGLHSIAFRVLSTDGGNSLYGSAAVKYFLLVPPATGADNALQTYEYWIDKQFDGRQSGAVPGNGIVSLNDLDVQGLNDGLHTFSMRVIDKTGKVSAAFLKYFLLVPPATGADNAPQTYEYWIDKRFDERQSGAVPGNGIVSLNDLDIQGLSDGLHTFSMRVIDKTGKASAAYVKNFLKVAPVSGDNSVQTYEYWFDQNYDEHVSGTVGEGGIADVKIDVTKLYPGEHTIYYRVIDGRGLASGVMAQTFTLNYVEGDANGDGFVTITDAVAVVNFILGNPSETFVQGAADVNKDHEISITDAVGVVNIILNSGNSE